MSAAFLLLLRLAADVDGSSLPPGLHLGAGLGGGVVGGDVVGVVEASIGIETEPFGLHLRAPLTLRVVDLPPPRSGGLPASCQYVRCEELLTGERLDATALARMVDELRLFRPGDAVALRAGRLTATLGSGGLVERATTVASWDRRTSGAWVGLRAPFFDLAVDAITLDVLAPWELMALRAEVTPFAGVPWVSGLEVAVDATAPVDVVDSTGTIAKGGRTRPVGSLLLDARAPLAISLFQIAPRLEVSADVGLSGPNGAALVGPDGGAIGVGAAAGGEASAALGVVGLRGRAMVGVSSEGHRRGLFSTFHLVERRRALAGSSLDGGGFVHVGAPGGVSLDARLDASIFDVVAPLVRLHLEPALGQNALEVGVAVEVVDVTVSASLIRRAFTDASTLVGADFQTAPLLGVAEASWRFYGPFSLSARWFRLPRFDATRGFVIDDDVIVGVNVGGALSPTW